MSEAFDVYHFWLGIPPAQHPPDHYALLGIARFESDQQKIAAAFEKRMTLVRRFLGGPRSELAQQLMQEIASAWSCLLNPEQKRHYDAKLRGQPEEQPDFTDADDSIPLSKTPVFTPLPRSTAAPKKSPAAQAASSALPKVSPATPATIRAFAPARKQRSLVREIIKHVSASVVGLGLGYLILCQLGPQYDFLGLWHKTDPTAPKLADNSSKTPTATQPAESSPKTSSPRPTPSPRAVRSSTPTTTTVSPKTNPRSLGGLSSSPTAAVNQPNRQAEDSVDETNPVFSELTARNAGRKRLPVPDPAAQTQASQAIAEQYKPSYDAAQTDDEKSELAKKLIQDGRRTTGDNAQRFVMMRIAKDIALKANDWETAFEAVDHIARYYDFDSLEAKAGMIMSLSDQLQQSDDISALYDAADAALEDAIAQDQYELARQFGRRAGSIATKMGNATLANEAAQKLAQAERFAAEYAALGAASQALARNPTDPAANLAMGKFLCFTKENWEQGLPMLALCADPTLKTLALAEVQRPGDAARQASLGDRWWELAQRHDGPPQMAMKARAAYWYQTALPRLTNPILKQRAEEHMAEVQADIKTEPEPMIVAQVFSTALALERSAQQMNSAKQGYALYREFITDGSVADDQKAEAKQRLGFWEEAAAKELVRLGSDWVSLAELQKAKTESLRLIDEALDLLSHHEGLPARSSLEKASRADPNGTRADFLLGILYAIDGRNFKKAQSHFATCMRREPQNVFAMNNWALAALMHGDHHGAQKQIRTTLEIGKSFPPLVHNVERILEANKDSKFPLMPAHKTTYMELIRKQRKPDEDRGWVYLIPRGEGDNKLVRTLNSDETRRMTCELLDNAIWVEDRTCAACKGIKTQPCTNRGCARGSILKTVNLPLSVDKKTGRVMGGTRKLREPCPSCDGKGHVDCPHCEDGLDQNLH